MSKITLHHLYISNLFIPSNQIHKINITTNGYSSMGNYYVKYSNSVNKINYSHEPKLECD